MPKKDLILPGFSSSLHNFPFLSRHTALGKAGLQNNVGLPASCSSAMETIANKEHTSTAIASNRVESALLPSGSLQNENDFQNNVSFGVSKLHPRPSGSQPPKLPYSAKLTNQSHQEDQVKIVSPEHQVIAANINRGVLYEEKTVEPVIASSCVCSGSSADRDSECHIRTLKRKDHDSEETEDRSEDAEEESLGVGKSAPARGGTGSKGNRTTEVHNLSERRRRVRINEKMRALQELRSNCNKEVNYIPDRFTVFILSV